MFYIMDASCIFDTRTSPMMEAVDTWGNDITIVAARREAAGGRMSKIFFTGAGFDYGIKAGDSVPYTEDTGMGHRNIGKMLLIENVVTVKDGVLVQKDNDIGLNEKRVHWTMK